MKARIVTLPGDGVGPEVIDAAVAVLEAVAERSGHTFEFEAHAIGGCAIDATGEPLPAKTLEACKHADAVLLGAVGGPKWSDPHAPVRPEQGLLALRAALGVFANLRPLQVHPALASLSPLKNEKLKNVDVLFVRELTGGAYFGAKTRTIDTATDECKYTVAEVERVTRRAFELARDRRQHVTSVDKANVLETSRLWRSTVTRIAADYPDVKLEHQLVDSMAMLLLTQPSRYDVVVPKTCSATFSPTKRPHWPARSACCRPRRWAKARLVYTSRFTVRPPTSPGRTSPIRSARFSLPHCCCVIRSNWKSKRRRSKPPSATC